MTQLRKAIDLGDVLISVTRKKIRRLHLSVYPPDGQVRISAPLAMPLEAIRAFALSKLEWIRAKQHKLRTQKRESAREYLDGESHYVWGKPYPLHIVETSAAPKVELTHNGLALYIRPGRDTRKRHEALDAWYREQIKAAVPALLARWETRIGVRVSRVLVQRMKTRWGSCNTARGIIRLNTNLARKSPICLEYVMAHELVHLLEPSHNQRFQSLMDIFLPDWRQIRNALNTGADPNRAREQDAKNHA
jgi:predicted metal-dependent hydrolase